MNRNIRLKLPAPTDGFVSKIVENKRREQSILPPLPKKSRRRSSPPTRRPAAKPAAAASAGVVVRCEPVPGSEVPEACSLQRWRRARLSPAQRMAGRRKNKEQGLAERVGKIERVNLASDAQKNSKKDYFKEYKNRRSYEINT